MELIRRGGASAKLGGKFVNVGKSMSKGQTRGRNIGWEMGGKTGLSLETRGGLGWSAVGRACHGDVGLVWGISIVM